MSFQGPFGGAGWASSEMAPGDRAGVTSKALWWDENMFEAV